ncbi:hypothetical protein [Marinimicrobium sp. ARAG 43.8]|uniref:hypothetical protein n=1 Tax=Marinimicrobium sp. ARAG 43.8 TaxID=3418719 RepID=UPI003CF0E79F
MSACFVFGWKDKNLKLEHRLTLARMVGKYGIEGSVAGGVRDISRRLKLPVEMISSAIRELTEGQYLVVKREGKIGRPSYSYSLAPGVKSAYKKGKAAGEAPHCKMIEALILDISSGGARKRENLSPVNAFVLAYLVYICGHGGVVPRLSKKRSLTELGIRGERLDSQLKKLKALGYVRGVRPGVYSKQFLGVVPRTIFIDLERCFERVGLPFDFEVLKLTFKREYTVAEAVYDAVSDRELVVWAEDGSKIVGFGRRRPIKPPLGVLRYFSDQNAHAVQDALQTMLDVCACEEIVRYNGDTTFDKDRFERFVERYICWYLPNSRVLPERLRGDERWMMDKLYNYVLATAREISRLCAASMIGKSFGDLVSLAVVRTDTWSKTFRCIITRQADRKGE